MVGFVLLKNQQQTLTELNKKKEKQHQNRRVMTCTKAAFVGDM
jgi:hypothetical protein